MLNYKHLKIMARLKRSKWFGRFIPTPKSLKSYPVLGRYGHELQKKHYLWSWKENHVGPALIAGSIIAFMPIVGIQLFVAMFVALLFKINLPILAGLTFISNPITLAPIYFANFKIGSFIFNKAGFSPELPENSIGIVSGINSTLLGGVILGSIVGVFLYGVYFVKVKYPAITAKRVTEKIAL